MRKIKYVIVTLMVVMAFISGCIGDTSQKYTTERGTDIKKPMETDGRSRSPVVTIGITTNTPFPTSTFTDLVKVGDKNMTIGENWNVGGGWTLVINAIDAKSNPRQVWFTLSKDGNKVDDVIMCPGDVYLYSAYGRYFIAEIYSVTSGSRTDRVSFKNVTYGK